MCSRKSVFSIGNKAFHCFCRRSRSPKHLFSQIDLTLTMGSAEAKIVSITADSEEVDPRELDLIIEMFDDTLPETLPTFRALNSCESEELAVPACRSFFTFPGSSSSRQRKFSGRKLVGFTMEEMYEVVSDVENYKNFVPFCKRSDVSTRTDTYLYGALEIGFPPIVESYVSHVTLNRPRLVMAECKDGKLFDYLITTWKFSPGLKNKKRTCVIDFHVDFQFKSVLHSQLAHMFFNELVRQMESAFFEEAERRFGAASIQTIKLKVVT